MNRKEFIKSIGFSILGAPILLSLTQSCTPSKYFAIAEFDEKTIIINKNEFNFEKNGKITERNQIFIKISKFKYPICVTKVDDNNYFALLMKCTHKGCELDSYGDFFICPCHGSEFDSQGNVLSSPAEENLIKFKTTTDKEKIYVSY